MLHLIHGMISMRPKVQSENTKLIVPGAGTYEHKICVSTRRATSSSVLISQNCNFSRLNAHFCFRLEMMLKVKQWAPSCVLSNFRANLVLVQVPKILTNKRSTTMLIRKSSLSDSWKDYVLKYIISESLSIWTIFCDVEWAASSKILTLQSKTSNQVQVVMIMRRCIAYRRWGLAREHERLWMEQRRADSNQAPESTQQIPPRCKKPPLSTALEVRCESKNPNTVYKFQGQATIWRELSQAKKALASQWARRWSTSRIARSRSLSQAQATTAQITAQRERRSLLGRLEQKCVVT